MEPQKKKLSYEEFRKRLWAHDKKFIWEKNEVVKGMYEENHPLAFSDGTEVELADAPKDNLEDSILLELRALREETAKVKWAVRGVGFLIALIILFGLTITQK
jgi:hypothetical protein